jgi:hypothetical protein
MWEVIRAPLVPRGSLETCTSTSLALRAGGLRCERGIQIEDLFFFRVGLSVPIILPGSHQHFQVVEVLVHVGHIEKSCFFQADVHKSRLHSGQDANDPSLVNIPADPLFGVSLHVELHQRIALQQSDSGFSGTGVDQDLGGHGSEPLN